MLTKFNEFISDQELSYIESIIGSPRWKWGWKSNPTDAQAFWQIDDLKDDEFFSIHLLNRIKELTGDDFEVERIYMNGHTACSSGFPHQDSKQENGRTFLIYCNREWQSEFGGGTAFVVDDEIATINPKPKSAIYFRNDVFHHATPLSKNFNGLRVTLAFKLYKI